MKKLKKTLEILTGSDMLWLRALRHGVAASIEHTRLLRSLNCRTVVDIGANRGQFALAARHSCPSARIIAFEPLSGPAAVFESVFCGKESVVLHKYAIGPRAEKSSMHVSGRDDSSSLLPISPLQEQIFPGTGEVETIAVQVAPLDAFVKSSAVVDPAMLKLDVQGFELNALKGCESLLRRFTWIYCECSFVELYSGQHLAADVIAWLSNRGFFVKGMYNPSYDNDGIAVQADFLFGRDTLGDDREIRSD